MINQTTPTITPYPSFTKSYKLIKPEQTIEQIQKIKIFVPNDFFSPTSQQADELDTDYAASLNRLSATLEQMLDRSTALGRDRLQWQSLVIEERFPTASVEKDQA